MKALFDERRQNFIDTVEMNKPKRIPIMANMAMWPIGYAGYTVNQCLAKPELVSEAFVKTMIDTKSDHYCGGGILVPVEVVKILGGNHYFVAEDGVTIQHAECCPMEEDEYDLYMKDPVDYIVNVFSLRKYKNLSGSKEEVYKTLKKALFAYKKQKQSDADATKAVIEKAGAVPIYGPSMGKLPLDIMFNKLRGFKGTLMDIRRQPEKVTELLEYIFANGQNKAIVDIVKKNGSLPTVPYAHHSVPFMRAKQFEKFWWPYFDKLARPVAEAGGKLFLRSESDSSYAFDYYKDYPKASFLYILEKEDPAVITKLMGDTGTYMGGMTHQILRYCSKEECIDYAKKAIDLYASDGKFIFTVEKGMIGKNDVNVENFLAVQQFVYEYGRY